MEEQKIYGDEKIGYEVIARDMSPIDARNCLKRNMDDGIYMQMNVERRIALQIRAEENQ